MTHPRRTAPPPKPRFTGRPWAWVPVLGLAIALSLAGLPRAEARPVGWQPVRPELQPQPNPPVRAGADTSRLRRNPKKQSLINKINRALQWLPGGANWPTIRFEKAESARAMPPTLPLASLPEDQRIPPSHNLPNLPKQL